MPVIKFENVSKTYQGGVEAVRNLSLEVLEGETLVLLGTSGCGKTTTLKMVNRLVEPTSGRVFIQGRSVMAQSEIALRRDIGYAIQHIGLFPHMSVGENIAVVPRLLDWTEQRINERIDRLLGMVGLRPEQFRQRYPAQLSGGQRQRVGVARALGADPPVVLMDEPFGALDPITREELQEEFIKLQAKLQKTIVFVTHDVFEAVRMADRIALMDQGRLQQLAEPAELVENPANEFVDNFLGQHRFQLSLLTRTVRSLILESDGAERQERPQDSLSVHDSFIAALDMFKRTARSTLPVYDEKALAGHLDKHRLLSEITTALDETGGRS